MKLIKYLILSWISGVFVVFLHFLLFLLAVNWTLGAYVALVLWALMGIFGFLSSLKSKGFYAFLLLLDDISTIVLAISAFEFIDGVNESAITGGYISLFTKLIICMVKPFSAEGRRRYFKDDNVFDSNIVRFGNAKLDITSLKNFLLGGDRKLDVYSEVQYAREAIMRLENLKAERLIAVATLYAYSSKETADKMLPLVSDCISLDEGDNTMRRYKDCALSICVTLKRYFGNIETEKNFGIAAASWLKKLKDCKIIGIDNKGKIIVDDRLFKGLYEENYGIRIDPCIVRDDNNCVFMRHGQKYKIYLFNDNLMECNAYLKIDGKFLGAFRIEGRSSICLERPPNDRGCFTFYEYGTSEGFKAGLRDTIDLGVVECKFKSAKLSECFNFSRVENKGGTGLSGESKQEFCEAKQIEECDDAVIIRLKLVSYKEQPHRLRSVDYE